MRIGALVRHAIPDHLAGAERALHETLEWMTTRGHECTVLSTRGVFKGLHDGVQVIARPDSQTIAGLFKQSDVVFTQLDAVLSAQIEAVTYQTPLVFYAHSPSQLEGLGVIPEACSLVLWNSKHVADAGAWWPGETMILNPPVFAEKYRVEPNGRAVTLIGLSHRKGVMQMINAARDLPSVQFIGVSGAYDDQVIDAGGFIIYDKVGMGDAGSVKVANMEMPANIAAGPPVQDMRPVYANTRVLLVLSEHESWGRVANEAMISGIPCLYNPTPGLVECLDYAGIQVPRDDHAKLARAIQKLVGDSGAWQAESDLALQRAAELDPLPQLLDLEARLERIVAAKPALTLG